MCAGPMFGLFARIGTEITNISDSLRTINAKALCEEHFNKEWEFDEVAHLGGVYITMANDVEMALGKHCGDIIPCFVFAGELWVQEVFAESLHEAGYADETIERITEGIDDDR